MLQPANVGESTSERTRAVASRLPAMAGAERDFARALARDLGLAPVDLYALGDLLAGPPVGVVDLGRRLGLGSAAATGLADRLEAAGHVIRTPHPSDRRRLILSVTDTARRAFFERLAAITAETQDLLDSFSETEIEAISRFVLAMTELYQRHAQAPPDAR